MRMVFRRIPPRGANAHSSRPVTGSFPGSPAPLTIIRIADDVNSIAVATLFQVVMGQKLVPVPLLLRRDLTGPLTKRASVHQSREKRPADELRAIGQKGKHTGKILVRLERYRLLPLKRHKSILPESKAQRKYGPHTRNS